MRLEAVTAELRPRSEWEAVDLGLAMVRRDFWRLSGAWWLGMLPALLLLPIAWEHPWWYLMGFGWWVPVGSRMALYGMSRALFGERVGWRALLREWPRAMGRRVLYRLVWARLSPWRPLTSPIEDLEGLRGRAYRARCRVLLQRGDSTVILLGMWRWVLMVWLVGILFSTSMWFVSPGAREEWGLALQLFVEVGEWDVPQAMSAMLVGAVLIAVWLVDLGMTGCGFGIYVNHRTWIEGWDVELAFRRLGRRLSGWTSGLVAAAVLWQGEVVRAAEADEVIEEILRDPDFTVHTETRKSWDGWDVQWLSGGAPGEVLGLVLQVSFWSVVVGLVVVLAYRLRHGWRRGGRRRSERRPAAARIVLGMEVGPESLPADVVRAAREAWAAGQAHQALSLLYRGAISWMIEREGVAIVESDTEADCVRRVSERRVDHADYFRRVTACWVGLAYGRELLCGDELESLCATWPFGERGAS